MSSWLVSLCPLLVWRCPTVTLGGVICHQVSACPSQALWPVGCVILSRTLIVSGTTYANLIELADHVLFLFSPFPPVKIIWEIDLFISHPHLTSCCWQGTESRVHIFSVTYPRLTSCRWRGTAFFMQVLSLWHIPTWHHVLGGELHFVCRSFLFFAEVIARSSEDN